MELKTEEKELLISVTGANLETIMHNLYCLVFVNVLPTNFLFQIPLLKIGQELFSFQQLALQTVIHDYK